MNLFMFSMLTLVLADNFLLMFVGWEGVGLCSYLLIGYYLKKDEARKAAKKAFVMNRIGDWGVLIGIFLIFTLTGTISFFDKSVDGTQVASALNIFAEMAKDPFGWGTIFAGGVTSVAVLLFIGATGKSAQIPLFTWLPDAMAGPDAGFGSDPRGDDGHGGRLYGRPLQRDLSKCTDRDVYRRDDRLRDRDICRNDRPRSKRY